MNLAMKKPCLNCPFLASGGIDLRPGRLEQIARSMVADDRTPFLCHKTVYGKNSSGRHEEDEDGQDSYIAGKNDSVCAGSMIFLLKVGAPNVAMRMGAALKMIDFKDLEKSSEMIIDPASLGF